VSDAQVAELTASGAEKIFKDIESGAQTDRPQLHKLLRMLEEGDLVLVSRLDRLARSSRDLLNLVHTIAEKKAGFKSLGGDAWIDTTSPHGTLLLNIIAALGEFERHLIRSRTGEGRQRAKARGVHFGRKFKLTPYQQEEARQRRRNGESTVEIGRSYNVSHSTISRLPL
jgi:DNA invertase Pin-like site-specific DNA recombinase